MFRLPQSGLSKTAAALSAFACMAGPCVLAQAPAGSPVTYDAQVPFDFINPGAPTLGSVRGVAVTAGGTLYVAGTVSSGLFSTSPAVVSIVPTSGIVTGHGFGGNGFLPATATVLSLKAATLNTPTAVAVDSNGTLYIADSAGHQVLKVTSPGSGTQAVSTITYSPLKAGTTAETPTALAVDSANDLYIADDTQNAIFKVTAGGSTGSTVTLGPGTYHPVGLTVDKAGDLFFADTSNQIYELESGATAATPYLSIAASNTYTFEFSSAASPVSMGFDPGGNLYVMDSGASHLFEIAGKNFWYLVPFSTSSTPVAMAVGSTGNLFVSDSTNKAVDELFYNSPVNFGSVNAGTKTPLVTANFQFNSGVTAAKIYQSVQGDYTGEFTTNTVTCLTPTGGTGSAGSTGDTCSFTFDATYLSATPGLRSGAVGYTDSNNDTLAVRANAIDVAASLALYPGTQISLAGQSFTEPQGLAITGDGGTLFVADEGGVLAGGSFSYNGAVWAVTGALSTPTYTKLSPGSFPSPTALAVDAAGNLYVADYSGNIYVVPPAVSSSHGNQTLSWSGNSPKLLTFPPGVTLDHPMALAIDPSGNLFIGDMGPEGVAATASNPGFIVEVPAGPMACGNSSCTVGGAPAFQLSNTSISGTPIVFPQALTTDSSGNLYLADGGDGNTDAGGIDVIPVATGTPVQLSLGTLNLPTGLGFDAAGDLYVLNGYTLQVLVARIDPSNPAKVDATVLLGTNPEGGSGSSGINSTLETPASLVVWPGGGSITIADIGLQQAGQPTIPAQVFTLSGALSTVNATSGSASVLGVNVGNTEATFLPPSQTGSRAFSLSGCGSASGDTLDTGIENTCVSTVSLTGSGAQSATFTLNGNTTNHSDFSALGNQIVATATSNVPPSGNACNGTYSGIFNGNITVSAGQNCIFVNGGVTGNVQQNGGNLQLTQSQVGGNVQVNGGGTFTIGPGSTIGGNLQVQNLPTGPGQNQVCGTTVQGDLQFQNSGTALVIGNPASCAGNNVGGDLQVQNNTAATTVDGNTVGGNLQDNNNTAQTQVFNNAVGNNLACQQDASITGGGNTARSKQGQCATF